MRFKAELPRETHPVLFGVVQRLERMESAGVPRSKRRAVVMLSPRGVSIARERRPRAARARRARPATRRP